MRLGITVVPVIMERQKKNRKHQRPEFSKSINKSLIIFDTLQNTVYGIQMVSLASLDPLIFDDAPDC